MGEFYKNTILNRKQNTGWNLFNVHVLLQSDNVILFASVFENSFQLLFFQKRIDTSQVCKHYSVFTNEYSQSREPFSMVNAATHKILNLKYR